MMLFLVKNRRKKQREKEKKIWWKIIIERFIDLNFDCNLIGCKFSFWNKNMKRNVEQL